MLLVAAAAGNPTFTVDSHYGLAITVEGLPADSSGTISWQRVDGVGPWVSQVFKAGAKKLQLLRFTPKKEYKFKVVDTSGSRIGSDEYYTCTAGATGVAQYDADMPLAKVVGRPTFELLVVDHDFGLVAVNADGWLVWHSSLASAAWDQLPNEDNFDIVSLGSGSSLSAQALREVTGMDQSVSSRSFGDLSHEARVDHAAAGLPVLTLQSETRNITGLRASVKGTNLMRWQRGSDKLETLYSLFDFYDPVTDYGQCSGRNNTAACNPPPTPLADGPAEDWTHANSVERGTQNNYIVSVRHLSSVVSFHADGSGIHGSCQVKA